MIRFNSSNHITLNKLEERMYSASEVLNFLKKFAGTVDIDLDDRRCADKSPVEKWFEQNVI